MSNIAMSVSIYFSFDVKRIVIVLTNRKTPINGPVVAELVMSADSITPGKKPVMYAIIVTINAYTTATYLIAFS